MGEIFPNAPLTEALIDIQVNLPPNVEIGRLEGMHAQIAGAYPDKKPRRKWEFELQLSTKEEVQVAAASKDLGVDGFLFTSADGKQVVQFRLDGFTFSRLKPYQDWQPMFAEAVRLWDIYRRECRPASVTRLATRYINQIQIPHPRPRMEDFFAEPPKVPTGLPQDAEEFFTRLVISYPADNVKAIVTMTRGTSSDPTKTSVLLDIDAFTKVDLPHDDERIPHVLGRLRQIKNDIFLGSVTEKTKELFR